MCCAMVQVVSCLPLIAQVLVQSQASPCGIYGVRFDARTGVSRNISVSSSKCHSNNTISDPMQSQKFTA
jgi:hypothetical protein